MRGCLLFYEGELCWGALHRSCYLRLGIYVSVVLSACAYKVRNLRTMILDHDLQETGPMGSC
jgi:hypothetical protein